MNDTDWLQGETAQVLVEKVTTAVVSRYRIDRAAAHKVTEEAFSRYRELRKLVENGSSHSAVERTRVFKDLVHAIKRDVYHRLRCYSPDREKQDSLIARMAELTGAPHADVDRLAAELAGSHASTRERLEYREEFYRQLLPLTQESRTILDVGSGIQPLLFPFDSFRGPLTRYIAADKDSVSTTAVNAYARARGLDCLVAVHWDIAEGWAPLLSANDMDEFDIAYLLKLVPVVERQDPESMRMLLQTPARIWIVTGSTIALTKRQSIERRERAELRRFSAAAGRRVVHEFFAGQEFGLVLER